MRIIAGALKGRRLRAPGWPGLRPTSDRLRETLFNILADRPQGARVLDACAGTGALGLEAISRGAAEVVFVDRDRRAATLVADNAAHCGVSGQVTVVCSPLPRAATDPALRVPFDVALVDPPYDTRELDAILSAVAGRLAASGLLVLERGARRTQPVVTGLTARRTVMAGDSALDFYVRSRTIGSEG